MQVKQISAKEARAFRASQTDVQELIADEWDARSEHYGCFEGERLHAVIRFSRAVNGCLPLSTYLPEVHLTSTDHEVSRLFARHDYRGRRATREFVRYMNAYTKELSGNTYLDVLTTGALRVNRYLALGFSTTPFTYSDPRYGQESLLLVRTAAPHPSLGSIVAGSWKKLFLLTAYRWVVRTLWKRLLYAPRNFRSSSTRKSGQMSALRKPSTPFQKPVAVEM